MSLEELVALLFGGGIVVTVIVIIIGVIISVLCTLAPFALVGWYLYRQSKQSKAALEQSQSWPSTAGIVLKSRVEVQGGDYASVVPRILYEYGVGGQTYQNDRIRPEGPFSFQGSGTAYNIVDRYPVGSAVVVYYNPANPAESALER